MSTTDFDSLLSATLADSHDPTSEVDVLGGMSPEELKALVAAAAEDEEKKALLFQKMYDTPHMVTSEIITPELVIEYQKVRMNPYTYVHGDTAGKAVVAISRTNLRESYLRRFTMTALVGFLFRMCDEWEVPAEARRWVPKGASKRARKEAKLAEDAEPPTPEKLAEIANMLQGLASQCLDLSKVAEEKQAAARDADRELKTMVAAGEEGVKAQREKTDQLLVEADKALAAARGLQYVTMFNLRRAGLDADKRIDSMARIASAHPEVRAEIQKEPIVRPVAGQQEMPAKRAKKIITDFLKAWFEFNPDAHVRSAHDEFVIKRATETTEVEGLGEVKVDSGDPDRLPLEVVRAAAPPRTAPGDAEAFDALTASPEIRSAATRLLKNHAAARGIVHAASNLERFKRYLCPIDRKSPARPAVDHIPPQDTFHRFAYYAEVNMEELRTATEAIYSEKPDLEDALIVYDTFVGTPEETEAALEKFRDEHQDEIISSIVGINAGEWTILGDFKANRDNVNIYNKKTEVLKRILDRHAEDQKMGAELMRKRLTKAKAANIRAEGPDAPGLGEYRGMHGNVGKLGGEQVISKTQMAHLNRAEGDLSKAREYEQLAAYRKRVKVLTEAALVRDLTPEEKRELAETEADIARAEEMLEVPDGYIQVDIHTHDTKTGSFKKSVMYTEAEDLHLPTPDLVPAVPTPTSSKPLAPRAANLTPAAAEILSSQK